MPENLPSLSDWLLLVAVTCGVYVALVLAAKRLQRVLGVRFRIVYHAFALVAGWLAAIEYAVPDFPWADAFRPHLAAALLLLAAFPGATLLNYFLWTRRSPAATTQRTPRLLADATTLVLCVVMLGLVLQFVYEKEVTGLLAGSGVAAIVLGLAMQDLLANTIAGIALFVEKPFKTGDWLLIDGREARVVEVTWRSVRLLTDEDVFLDVPNSKVVQESIINFHQPDATHAVKTTIGLHYDIPPARAMEVLRKTAACVRNTCPEFPPRIEVMALGASAVEYEVEVTIDDHTNVRQVLSDLRMNLWYAARRAGMEIPYPQLTVQRARPMDSGRETRARAARALRRHEIFGALDGAVLDQLAERSAVQLFAASEHIIEQGEAASSMFLLVRGTAEVRIERDGRTSAVARIGPGDVAGEMSLLTGDPRGATVVATSEVEAVEIRLEAFAEHVRADPGVLARLSDLLARRQLANERQLAHHELAAKVEATRETLLHRFRKFFQLGE